MSPRPARARQPAPVGVSPAFRQFVLDQLADLGDVCARSMFGGVGLYCNGTFFGIAAGDVLYLKVDETTRADYTRAGMKPFAPYPHRAVTMRYYEVPLGVLESPSELVAWARKAVKVARSAGRHTRRKPTTRR